MGDFSPAAAATSVNFALNGMPDGLPRGIGRTPRVAIPCPRKALKGNAANCANLRRVSFITIAESLACRMYLPCPTYRSACDIIAPQHGLKGEKHANQVSARSFYEGAE